MTSDSTWSIPTLHSESSTRGLIGSTAGWPHLWHFNALTKVFNSVGSCDQSKIKLDNFTFPRNFEWQNVDIELPKYGIWELSTFAICNSIKYQHLHNSQAILWSPGIWSRYSQTSSCCGCVFVCWLSPAGDSSSGGRRSQSPGPGGWAPEPRRCRRNPPSWRSWC